MIKFLMLFLMSFFASDLRSAEEISPLLTDLPTFSDPIESGNTLFKATLFDQAAFQYAKMWEQREENVRNEISIQLAYCYQSTGKHQEALEVLKEFLKEKGVNGADLAYFLLGVSYRNLKDYSKAIEAFKMAQMGFPQNRDEIQLALGMTYFLNGESQAANALLQQLMQISSQAKIKTTCQLYLAKMALEDQEYEKAHELMELIDSHSLGDIRACHYLKAEHRFLLGHYIEAAAYLEQIVASNEDSKNADLYGNLGWCYLKAAKQKREPKYFDQAEMAFKKTVELLPSERTYLTLGQCYVSKALVLKDSVAFQQAEEILSQKHLFESEAAKIQALLLQAGATPLKGFQICEELLNQPDRLKALPHQEEVEYLKAFFAAQIFRIDRSENFYEIAVNGLKQKLHAENPYADSMRYLLGCLYFEKEDYETARESFCTLLEQYPFSKHIEEAVFAIIQCVDRLNQPDEGKKFRLLLLEKYPKSLKAPEVHFTLYPFQEYLQGDKPAIKHLQQFAQNYPQSPLSLYVHFLIGLDCKRDRKTPEGKWIRKKNLKAAVDSFQTVETMFTQFSTQKQLAPDQFKSFLNLYYKAKLERALTNLAIADNSIGAKRTIYLEYTIEVLREIKEEIIKNKHLEELASGNMFPLFQEEYLFYLAQAYIKAGYTDAAEKELSEMLEKYEGAKITRGYYLSRVWYEKGIMAQHEKNYEKALRYFDLADDAGKGRILPSEQRLSLWIEQSLCYRELKQLDQAMLSLSRVINSDIASGLRLKAMLLRSEIYTQQERHELARKQLETVVKSGGEWSQEAQKRLEEKYARE